MGKEKKQEDKTANIAHLQQQLDDLSTKELRLLIRSAEFLLAQRSQADLPDEEHEANQMLFDLMNSVILAGNRARALVPRDQTDYPTFLRRHPRAVKALSSHRKLLENFVQANYGTTDLNEYSQLYTLFFRVLIRALRKEGTAVGVVSIIEHIPRIPQVLDDAFPGYIPAGLLRILVKSPASTLH